MGSTALRVGSGGPLARRLARPPGGVPSRIRIGSQAGFTLIELLIAISIVIVVFTATLAALISGLKAQTTSQTRVSQLQQTQVAVARLVHDLREATSVTVSSTSSITYVEPLTTSTTVTVTFTCTSGTCTRALSSGGSTTAITNVANTDIFTASPNSTSPTYIGVKLTISATGRTSATLTDGAGLRNITLGQ